MTTITSVAINTLGSTHDNVTANSMSASESGNSSADVIDIDFPIFGLIPSHSF